MKASTYTKLDGDFTRQEAGYGLLSFTKLHAGKDVSMRLCDSKPCFVELSKADYGICIYIYIYIQQKKCFFSATVTDFITDAAATSVDKGRRIAGGEKKKRKEKKIIAKQGALANPADGGKFREFSSNLKWTPRHCARPWVPLCQTWGPLCGQCGVWLDTKGRYVALLVD